MINLASNHEKVKKKVTGSDFLNQCLKMKKSLRLCHRMINGF